MNPALFCCIGRICMACEAYWRARMRNVPPAKPNRYGQAVNFLLKAGQIPPAKPNKYGQAVQFGRKLMYVPPGEKLPGL